LNLTFDLENFWINEDKSFRVEVELVLTEFPTPDIRPSLNEPGEPGEPAVYEIHAVNLIDDSGLTLILSETEFATFFENGQDVMNSAYEWASEQEIEHE
jgi:hypothetical protein